MDPASQELQLRRAGVPLSNIPPATSASPAPPSTQGRQGWHQLDGRLAGGDTLVVVAIGRTWQDTVRSICELQDRGVRIRSLAEAEAQWAKYLEADEGSPKPFSAKCSPCSRRGSRTKNFSPSSAGLGRGWSGPASRGRSWPPRKFRPHQVETMRRMRDGASACGGSPLTSSVPPAPFCGCCSGRTGLKCGYSSPTSSPQGKPWCTAAPLALTVSDAKQDRAPVPVGGTAGRYPRRTSNDHFNSGRTLWARPREPLEYLQHEVHSSDDALSGPQGENGDGKVWLPDFSVAAMAVAAMTLASVAGTGLAQAQTNTSTDRAALVSLYNATDGDNWGTTTTG